MKLASYADITGEGGTCFSRAILTFFNLVEGRGSRVVGRGGRGGFQDTAHLGRFIFHDRMSFLFYDDE